MVALALATSIAPSVWAEQTDEAIATALELLEERAREVTEHGG